MKVSTPAVRIALLLQPGLLALCLLALVQCHARPSAPTTEPPPAGAQAPTQPPGVVVGAARLDVLLPKLAGKRIALVVNNTALINKTHLADTLKSRGVNLVKIFGPEHGFRGNAANGEHVQDSIDHQTGVLVVSLYGKNRKPTPRQLADVDIVIFDIQDVGARFYTYISTLHYLMEACAENSKHLIILDRPNPNGSYVDGPIRKPEFKSFLAMHPIPFTHGMTLGEMAGMINGEGWLDGQRKCDFEVVQLLNWKHTDDYSLPVRPSPNLPNDQAIRLYPSICLFEGTDISLGRGTEMPFQILGSPALKNVPNMTFQFTPVEIKGVTFDPPHENELCYGIDLRQVPAARKVDLQYLLKVYKLYPAKEKFFIKSFNVLAGTEELQQQIKAGLTEEQIRASWQPGLDAFKEKRKKYLLYP
jgi:uncharacterized protein YbbC (DUF1343 family)